MSPTEWESGGGYRRQAIEAHVTRADGTRADVPLPAENVREVHSIRFPEVTGPTATVIAAGYWPSVVRAAIAYERAAEAAAARADVLAAAVGLTVDQLARIVRMLDTEPARRPWRLYGQRRGHRSR